MFFIIFVLIPDNVYAWGPAAHLEFGRDILNNLRFLPLSLQGLLLSFPYDYLYGNISADIVVGKNMTETLKHCHNWRIGLKVLKSARTDSQKAFAYGYISHLAADTIAHNYYIPEKFIQSFSSRVLKHTYWEIRFDALADKSVWKLSSRISKRVHRGNDGLLKNILEDTPLSFRTNKTIFSSILLIHRLEQWQNMLSMFSSSSRWVLSTEERREYYNRSLTAIKDFLTNGPKAKCFRDDPTGRARLDTAKRLRSHLKKLKRNGKDWETAMEKALHIIKS
ncbi:MAG TPA: zinc dependent phospholipase C family protein [Thermodesulfobacteriota bacterium]|nr:zinc dependent phospholipase C family protein [Thermodesulfobacteriota bacterium]